MALPSKPRKCRNTECRKMFQPVRCGQNTCSYECSVAVAEIVAAKSKLKRDKAERIAQIASTKILRLKLKTKGEWMKEAQAAFNAYIRMRDQLAGHHCISSGQPLDWSGNNVDAGHYRSRGSAPHLRFDERNCHAQSKKDNSYLSGNAVDYRIGLIARIGLEAVESLESDQTPRKYTIDELRAIKSHYVAKLKELKHGN